MSLLMLTKALEKVVSVWCPWWCWEHWLLQYQTSPFMLIMAHCADPVRGEVHHHCGPYRFTGFS